MEQTNRETLSTDQWRARLAATTLDFAVASPVGQFSPHAERDAVGTLEALLGSEDNIELVNFPVSRDFNPAGYDAAIAWRPCGRSRYARDIAGWNLPVFALQPSLGFHPFHAVMERDLRHLGSLVLDSHHPSTTRASIHALRAKKALMGIRLLVIDDHVGAARGLEISRFADLVQSRFGIEIVHLPTAVLREQAALYKESEVEEELQRWWRDHYIDRGEISRDFLLQSVRLYLGLKELLAINWAAGVTVDDIGAFLLAHRGEYPEGVMPNLAYGVLVDEGYLACEEGDIEALTTELLLAMAYGKHPTMSNIYLAYLDGMDAVERYETEDEVADFQQCLRDNVVVAAHFSTSGVLPPDMRQEQMVPIRETVPSWPGQGMMAGTPKLGPVHLARLDESSQFIHAIQGDVVELRLDDSKKWYRGRWVIKLPSVESFVRNCLHQHYAIGPAESAANFSALMYLLGVRVIS